MHDLVYCGVVWVAALSSMLCDMVYMVQCHTLVLESVRQFEKQLKLLPPSMQWFSTLVHSMGSHGTICYGFCVLSIVSSMCIGLLFSYCGCLIKWHDDEFQCSLTGQGQSCIRQSACDAILFQSIRGAIVPQICSFFEHCSKSG